MECNKNSKDILVLGLKRVPVFVFLSMQDTIKALKPWRTSIFLLICITILPATNVYRMSLGTPLSPSNAVTCSTRSP